MMRDVRFYFLGAVVLLGAFALGSACGGGSSTADSGRDPAADAPAFSFRVTIDGEVSTDKWVCVRGLGPGIGISSGTANGREVHNPAGGEPVTVTMEGTYTAGGFASIIEWVEELDGGGRTRKDIIISVIDESNTAVQSFNLFDCFPVSFTLDELGNEAEGAAGNVVHWTLEVRVNRIDMA